MEIKLVFVGEVDHGKSTVIGRVLSDTKVFADDKVAKVREICKKQGRDFEYAFLLDALEEEQKHGITIDTTRINFSTPQKDFTIIDAPGHKEFLKSMISGASKADYAVIIVDAKEGIKEQSKKHCQILSILGIRKTVVLLNKMDLVGYKKERFLKLKKEFEKFSELLGMEISHFIPVSAKSGDNISKKSPKMKWYTGPTFISAINKFQPSKKLESMSLRLPVQDSYRFEDDKRIIVGRIESGQIKVGDEVCFAPSQKKSKVATIEKWKSHNAIKTAGTGESIGITIKDELFVERGQIICHPEFKPMHGNIFTATIFWIAKSSLQIGKRYGLRLSTNEVDAEIVTVNKVFDSATFEAIKGRNEVKQNEIAEVVIQTDNEIAFDNFNEIQPTGRFVLIDNHNVCGGGIIMQSKELLNRNLPSKSIGLVSPTKSLIALGDRVKKYGHKPKVIWFTGIPGSGRNSIARGVEKRLFDKGYNAYLLSGANLRLGLSADLDYSEKSRHEQARRIAEISKLFLDAGIVVIVSSVSPYEKDREYAKKLIGDNNFVEVFAECDISVCRKRDPHGLIENTIRISGFDAPYERPLKPDVHVDTTSLDFADSIDIVYEKIKKFL